MVGQRTWRNRVRWMAFLVWGGGSPLAAQTLVPDSLLQTRARLSCTGGALWGSQPTWGVFALDGQGDWRGPYV
ncbi:MAG: hypothetical protein VX446_03485, partial [Bacteroidota bacterium]|nr:hypothetical protein [Bacteroidota bacterium]